MLGVALAADGARACSPPAQCPKSVVFPTEAVPGNLPGFQWRHAAFEVDPGAVQLERFDDDAWIPVAVGIDPGDMVIRPGADLVAGTYRLTVPGACESGDPNAMVAVQIPISVVSDAPYPKSLGPLTVSALVQDDLEVAASGSCSEMRDAVFVQVVLPSAAEPWLANLDYRAFVDGEPWHYSSSLGVLSPWIGEAETLVYRLCDADPGVGDLGVDEGTHVIEIRGRVPGTDAWIASDFVKLKFECQLPASAEPASAPSQASGCATVGATSPGVVGIFLLLLTLLLLTLIRRGVCV